MASRNSNKRQTPSGPPPVLILGTGLTVLGVMRCLGRKRIPLYCVSEGLGFEGRSRWCRRLPPGIGAFAPVSDLERVLESLPWEKAVLIACSDHWTVEVTRLSAPLRDRFRVCLPETAVLRSVVNKGGFAELLGRARVPHPFTEIAQDEQHVLDLADKFNGQLFLKPTDSQRFLKTFGAKAYRIEDTDRAISIYRRARDAGLDVMVQEYIPGPSDRHYFVDGFVDREHRLRACFARHRIRMFPLDFGNSSYMVSVPLDRVSGAVKTVETLFELAGYRGIFSAEFKLDERDGQFKILEVNCRPWWYVQYAAECGVDVVEMAYRDALDMPLPEATRYKAGVRFVFPYYDSHALREMRRRGESALRAFASSWPRARTPIFSWDDPLPGIVEFTDRLAKKI